MLTLETATGRTPQQIAKRYRPIAYVMNLCDLLDLTCDLGWLRLMRKRTNAKGIVEYSGKDIADFLLQEIDLKDNRKFAGIVSVW